MLPSTAKYQLWGLVTLFQPIFVLQLSSVEPATGQVLGVLFGAGDPIP